MSPKTNSCHYIVSTVIPTHVSLQRDNKMCQNTACYVCHLRCKFKIKKREQINTTIWSM
jgi:hypothetical protein